MPERAESTSRYGQREWLRRIGRLLLFAAILLSLWIIGTLVHELGHGFTAMLFGGKINAIYLYPGVEIYPQFGDTYRGTSYNYFGSISIGRPSGLEDWQDGWIVLMGSGSTLLVSLTAQVLLWRLKPTRLLPRYILIALALFYLDMVSYTLPGQLGLPRLILVGRIVPWPETLSGAVRLGISPGVFNAFNVVILIALTYSLIRFVRSAPEPPAELGSIAK